MASGDPVVQINLKTYPATVQATPGLVTGGSTIAERIPVDLFSASADNYLDFECELIGYDGGGLTLVFKWTSDATTGNARWGAAIRRMQDDAEDIDSAHTYDFNTVDDATANVAGEPAYTTITFTDGADMDSLANGEIFILRLRREASHANDTMNSNVAELWSWSGRET